MMFGSSSSSDASMFLQIDGITGNSKNKKHRNWIEIQSFSFNAYRSASFVGSKPKVRSIEPAQMNEISISRTGDSASPDILALAVGGAESETPRNAIISLCSEGGKEYAQYKLSDVLITQYSASAGGYGGLSENFSINFVEMEFTHFPAVKKDDEDEEEDAAKELKVKEEPKTVTYSNKTGSLVV